MSDELPSEMSDGRTERPLIETYLSDPLTELTRRERRMLLAVCAIGLIIAKTGFIPKKITALGIDFDPADQRTMLEIIAVIVTYLLVAFVFYALSDVYTKKSRYAEAARLKAMRRIAGEQLVQKLHRKFETDAEKRRELLRVYPKYPSPKPERFKPVAWARGFVDLIVPPSPGDRDHPDSRDRGAATMREGAETHCALYG
jgi:hypothetical protein